MSRSVRILTCCLSLAAVGGVAMGQSWRLAWTRTSANADTTLDAAHDGIINRKGNVVLAGGSAQIGAPMKGNLTIFSRNWTKLGSVEVSPPGGGPLQFCRLMEEEGIFYFAVGRTETVGNNESLYIAKFDANLNKVAERVVEATTAGGTEKPTDIQSDHNGHLYICGLGQAAVGYENFLLKIDTNLNVVENFNIQTPTAEAVEPSIAPNGIIAILIGLLTPSGPVVRKYSPAGVLEQTIEVENDESHYCSIRLENTMISGFSLAAVGWTVQPVVGGPFESRGVILKINSATGQVAGQHSLPAVQGQGAIVARDVTSAEPAGKRLNALFEIMGKPTMIFCNEGAKRVSSWTSSQVRRTGMGFAVDPFGSPYGLLLPAVQRGSWQALKLNPNNIFAFSWGASTNGFLLPYIEQSNLHHQRSGDVLTLTSDGQKFQLTCMKQAPVALGDTFQARSGKQLSSPTSVFANDRYFGDGSVRIVREPMHGIVSINAFGYFLYKSTSGYTGPDSFAYELSKPALSPSTASVSLTVVP